jgi:hypothetical protein
MKDITTQQRVASIRPHYPEQLLEELAAGYDARANTAIHADTPLQIPAESLGRLSAEAVQKQYEVAAQEVTKMGIVIKERIQALEQCLQECDNDLKVIGEMSQAIVDKGTHVAAEIEQTNAVAADIRAACADFQKKIVGGKS